MPDLIQVNRVDEGIFQLTMDYPETHNGLDDRMIEQFFSALNSLQMNPKLHVLLIAGREDVFCSGATKTLLEHIGEGTFHAKDLLLPRALLQFPLPTIAVLQGYAVGGGLALGLCCDMAIASETSRYGVNFMNMGFTPGMGTTGLLPALTGYSLATEMMFSGKLYAGNALREFRLFNRVVPANQVMNSALSLAREIAEKPRHALELLKQSLALPRKQILEYATNQEHLMHGICFAHPEFRSRLENRLY